MLGTDVQIFTLFCKLNHTRRSDVAHDPDGPLKTVVRIKIRYYHELYLNRPDPIVFLPLTVNTSGGIYDDFIRLLFLHTHREASALDNELPEESDEFCFLHADCHKLVNLKGSVGLILVKASDMRISIPLDLSSRSFIPLSRFIRSLRPTPLLAPSLVLFPHRSASAAHVGFFVYYESLKRELKTKTIYGCRCDERLTN